MAIMEREPRVREFVGSKHQLLIDGQWVDAASGETFATLNPATEEVLAAVPRGRAEDIDRAERAARRAFEDGSPWRRMTPSDWGKLIHRVGDLKESGWGREMGHHVLENYLETKSVITRLG